MGVGHKASAGLVWKVNSKMVQELWVKNTSEYDSGWCCSKTFVCY